MPVVETRWGRVGGERRRDVLVFRGVPFARPPVRERRWAPPEPPVSWTGVRRATRFSPVAPQLGSEAGAIGKLYRWVRGGVSEDCLYLNVWTPGLEGSDRPVLLWIHGGAFLIGAGSTFVYDGSALARRGAVVVTCNYRLGAFGFLDLTRLAPGAAPPANLGLRDQQAAIDWVAENIAAFGGDPDNVTLFGESAGAMSLGAHLGRELPEGSRRGFRRAILQSGAAANVSTPEQADYVSRRFLAELGVAPRDWRRLLELPMETLLEAQRRALAGDLSRMGRLPWQPSVDGDLLHRPPLDAIRAGSARDVDLLIGSNREEWKLFGLGEVRLRRMGPETLRTRVARVLARRGGDPEAADELIAEHRRRVAPGRRQAYETWVSIRTEQVFGLPAIELAEAHSARHPNSYAYRFDEPAPRLPRALGACHGIDLGYVFGTYRHLLLRPVYGTASATRRLSEEIQTRWVEFARTGIPALEGAPQWEPYDTAARTTMSLARSSRLVPGSDGANRRFWPG